MAGIFDHYPYTDFHEMNLDFILQLARQSMGLHLDNDGDKLVLKNAANEVVSQVTVSYATKALKDVHGNDLDGYILTAGVSGTKVIFTKGDGDTIEITVPYATKAKKDANGNDIDDYVYSVSVNGDKLRITKGDGTVVDLTVPFATKASTDNNGKDLTTYAATLTAELDKVVLRDSQGRLLSSVTVPYATAALNDADGDEISETYATELAAGTTTVLLKNKDGDTLSSVTVPYATHAGSAIETVAIVGDQLTFTTYDGTTTTITVPYAVKALKDNLNNQISTTYVANVVNDPQTGKLIFQDAMGQSIVELLPTVDSATHDNLGNDLTDYILSVVNNTGSNYVTVTHGDGTVDSITIHYAETAWKDTNGNVIKNFYVARFAIVESPAASDDFYLVAYNGDTPEAELFRIKLISVDYDAVNMDISITIGGI